MGARAHQVQVANAFGTVVKTEPGRLSEQRRNRKTGTVDAEVIVLEVLRRHAEFGRDGSRQAGQDRAIQRGHDAVAQPRALYRPIDVCLQIGHRAQHVEALAARRREARIGGGGPVQVERKVFAQHLLVEDFVEQFAVALAQPDGVVGHVRIGLAGTEVKDEQAHRITGLLGLRNHRCVQVGGVGVADHQVCRDRAPIDQFDRGGRPGFDANAAHGAAKPNFDAAALQQRAQRAGDGPGAAHREKHTVRALQIMNQPVNAGGVERVAADQQRLDRESLAQLVVLQEFFDQTPNGAVAAQADQAGDHPQHGAQTVEWLV